MSLLGIQKAQGKSLNQHIKSMNEKMPGILDISIEKGGTSVLADACLVKGSLTMEEAYFAFGFGVLLQFLDDLQDVAADRRNGHQTIFSKPDAFNSQEINTNKLINFMNEIIDGDNCFLSSDAISIKNMIKKSIMFLIYGAVACNRSLYSKEYLYRLEGCSPLSFRYLESFYKKAEKEYGKFKIRLSVMPIEEPMAKAFAAGSL